MKTIQSTQLSLQALMHYIEQFAETADQVTLHKNNVIGYNKTTMTVQIDDPFGYFEAISEENHSLLSSHPSLYVPTLINKTLEDYVTDTITYHIDVTRKDDTDQFYLTIREAEHKSYADCLTKDVTGTVHYTPREYKAVPQLETMHLLTSLAEQAYMI